MSKSEVVVAPPVPQPSASDAREQLARTVMLDPPTVLGRYALFGRIGAGGMGVVHLGRLLGSAGFERAVAIKRIHPLLASDQQFIATREKQPVSCSTWSSQVWCVRFREKCTH